MNNVINSPGFRLKQILVLITIGTGLSYSVSVYFFKFFELPDRTKITLFFILFFLFLIVLLINKNFQTITRTIKLYRPEYFIVVLIFAISTLFITKASLQWIPSRNTFELTILPPTSAEVHANSIEIYEITSLPPDDKQRKLLTTDDLELTGNWTSEGDILRVTGNGG